MGKDKGFMEFNGKTFMSLIIEALESVVGTIIIVSNNNDYDVFNLKRVDDIMKDSGPLAGLYSGLFHSETENNIVLSCDVPLINSLVLKELINEFDIETEAVQIESKGKTMPLVAMYKKQCMHPLLKQLKQGEGRLTVAVEQLNIKTIKLIPELEQHLRNINTLSELKQLRHEFEH